MWKFGGKLIERIFFDAILCFSLSYFIWQASYSFIPGSYCNAFSTLFRHNDINNLYVTLLLQHIGYMGFNWYLCRNSGSLIFFLLLSFYDLSIILRQKYHFFIFPDFFTALLPQRSCLISLADFLSSVAFPFLKFLKTFIWCSLWYHKR